MNKTLPFRIVYLTIAVVALSLSVRGFAQTSVYTDSVGIPFVAYWEKGDSYDFIITKIRHQWKDGDLVKNDSVSYRANFAVIDSTETSYKIRWTYQTQLGEINIPENLLPDNADDNITEVIYSTDELGAFEEVENWREIANQMNGIFDSVFQAIETKANADDKEDIDFLKNMITNLKSIYSSKEGIENLVAKELRIFHFPMGVEFSTTEPIHYEDELPNLLGGAPIKADGVIQIEEFDEDKGFCVLTQQMSINPNDTKKILTDLFTKMGLDESSAKEAIDISQIEMTDNNRYEYFYYPGIPYFIQTHRKVLMNISNQNGRREDILRIQITE